MSNQFNESIVRIGPSYTTDESLYFLAESKLHFFDGFDSDVLQNCYDSLHLCLIFSP